MTISNVIIVRSLSLKTFRVISIDTKPDTKTDDTYIHYNLVLTKTILHEDCRCVDTEY